MMLSAFTDSQVTPGVLGFLVVAALGVATWLLIRSMRRQLHKIDFAEPTDQDDDLPPGSAESPSFPRESSSSAEPPSGSAEPPSGSAEPPSGSAEPPSSA
jgi:hypothetical protein